MKKVVACIIARTNSTRLPQKVLRKVNGNDILIEYLINKIKKAKLVDEIYLCTSTHRDDSILLDIAQKNNIKSYAGSEDSVIDRMLDVAKIENASEVIRITGDNIFTDEVYIDVMIDHHLKNDAEYTRTEKLPIGVTAEIINVDALSKCRSMIDPDESQYLMLYMFQPEIFKCNVLIPPKEHQYPEMTLTVDTPDDFQRTLSILKELNTIYDLSNIINICNNRNIPYVKFDAFTLVKFPANLSVYFKVFRLEMDIRIQQSNLTQLDTDSYLTFKKAQNA